MLLKPPALGILTVNQVAKKLVTQKEIVPYAFQFLFCLKGTWKLIRRLTMPESSAISFHFFLRLEVSALLDSISVC